MPNKAPYTDGHMMLVEVVLLCVIRSERVTTKRNFIVISSYNHSKTLLLGLYIGTPNPPT